MFDLKLEIGIMFVLSSSMGLSGPSYLAVAGFDTAPARPPPPAAYFARIPLAPAVSTVSFMLFLRHNSFTGDALVIILGLAMALIIYFVVSPETLESMSDTEPPLLEAPSSPGF